MQTKEVKIYDCAIIGGGIAGLSLAIQLARQNYSVIVFEKKKFPFHKVCGEYVSNESYAFIESLGVPLSKMDLPVINTLNVTAHKGYKISSTLPLGGFGISRYTLDNELKNKALANGAIVNDDTNVTGVEKINNLYNITTSKQNLVTAKLVIGSYGKYRPSFISNISNNTNNYIGVKYHLRLDFPGNLIELHNFKNGYCGISRVDGDKACLCYLTTSANLKQQNNNIRQLESHLLSQNPHLKKYFSEAEFLYAEPLTVSNIRFGKQAFKNNLDIIPLGDAAGSIAPLCGNGMSIALQSAYILSGFIQYYFNQQISRRELIDLYEKQWNKLFKTRIATGKFIQKLIGNSFSTLFFLKFLNSSPAIFKRLILLTHGSASIFKSKYISL